MVDFNNVLLSGAEYVLVAQVPKAGGRWKQVHFNRSVAEQFFGLKVGDSRSISLARVNGGGGLAESVFRTLIYAQSNKNPKIEFDFSPAGQNDYPVDGTRPLLIVVNIDIRTFRYRTLMPSDPGFTEMDELNRSMPTVGSGLRRVITTLDEVELRWPQAGLRKPSMV